MKRLEIYLDVVFVKLTQFDWDNVWILAGDEGTGKSHLGMHITDRWYTKLYGKCLPEHAQHISLGLKEFVIDLKELKQFELEDYDEAGQLSNLRMMDRFNYAVTQGYQVIRGANLFTLLIIPDLWLLNAFFTKRRARGFIQVYRRGCFAYWGKEKLRDIIDKNSKYVKKNPWRVMPDFYDTFPKYNGPLLAPYLEKKAAKVNSIRTELYDKICVQEAKGDNELKWINNAKNHVGVTKAAAIFECTKATIYNKIKEYHKLRAQEYKIKGV